MRHYKKTAEFEQAGPNGELKRVVQSPRIGWFQGGRQLCSGGEAEAAWAYGGLVECLGMTTNLGTPAPARSQREPRLFRECGMLGANFSIAGVGAA